MNNDFIKYETIDKLRRTVCTERIELVLLNIKIKTRPRYV